MEQERLKQLLITQTERSKVVALIVSVRSNYKRDAFNSNEETTCESCLNHSSQKKDVEKLQCEGLKDVVMEGKKVEALWCKLDPKTIHLINPSDNQLYETFTRLDARIRSNPDAIVLFCYNGHGVEFKDSLHALLTEGSVRTLFPLETKLN